MLNYPRRDCASLALEEVKRFLESVVGNNLLERIIFVVYSSNDEFVYKSLMPVYFPPTSIDSKRLVTRSDTAVSASSDSSDAPRRTLFGSIGEAFRSVAQGKQSATSRSITANEEHALIEFESHAKHCETCGDIDKLYLEGKDLCERGYFLAQTVLWHMNMLADQEIYTKPNTKGTSVRLELPTEMFPISMQMLRTVEQSYRDELRSRPFVTPNRSYDAIMQDQGVDLSQNAEDGAMNQLLPKKARARVFATQESASEPTAVSSRESQILVYPDRVNIFPYVDAGIAQLPLLSLGLNDASVVQRHKTTPEVELNGVTRLQPSTLNTKGKVSFRCRSDNECNSLLRYIRQAILHIQESPKDDASTAIILDTEARPSDDRGSLHGVTTLVKRRDSEEDREMTLGDKIHVSSNMINIHSSFGAMGESPLLYSLQLHGSSTVQRQVDTPVAKVFGATHLPSFYRTEGNVEFRCRSDEDCDRLVRMSTLR